MSASVHVSLYVSDLDRSVDFYRRFFGEPKKLKNDYAKFVHPEPQLHLAIRAGLRAPARSGALSHLGIRVDSIAEVERWKGALSARGVRTEEERLEACCYAVQEKFRVSDPDGNRWEVYTVLEDLDRPKDASSTCCAS